jgi:hypothetical protein
MTLQRSTRARLTTGLVLLLVLASGVVLGIALDRQLDARGVIGEESGRPDGRPGMDGRSRGFDSRSRDSSRDPSESRGSSQRGSSLIVEQVGLSEAQQVQVDSIVGYFRTQMRNLHSEFDEAYTNRFQELNQTVRAEVRAILTTEQRTVYDSLQADWQRRRQDHQDSITSSGGQRNEL